MKSRFSLVSSGFAGDVKIHHHSSWAQSGFASERAFTNYVGVKFKESKDLVRIIGGSSWFSFQYNRNSSIWYVFALNWIVNNCNSNRGFNNNISSLKFNPKRCRLFGQIRRPGVLWVKVSLWQIVVSECFNFHPSPLISISYKIWRQLRWWQTKSRMF